MNSKTLMLCDFDGTVSMQDIGHEVIKRFMENDWVEVDEDYAEGKIGSMAAYRRIESFLKVAPEEMASYTLGLANMDPYFGEFYRFCKEQGFDLKILSDGLDFYIDFVLKLHGFADIEFFSNAIRFHDDRSVSIDFPRHNEECARCGTCKSFLLQQYRLSYEKIVYIGDSYSDVCPSQYADLVFGKDILYEKCREKNRNCIHYRNFRDIQEILQKGRYLA